MPELYLILAGALCIVFLTYTIGRGVTLGTAGGWVVLACIHGLLIKPLFVYYNIPNADLLDNLLFQGVSRDEYWRWGMVSLVAYGLFFFSMVFAGRYTHLNRPLDSDDLAMRYHNWRLLIFLCIPLVGVAGFFLQFPELLESMSKNQIATTDLAEYHGGGQWRSLIDFSYIVSLCALVNAGANQNKRSSLALFFISALVWLPFCYLSDQRGLILFSAVTYLVAYNRYIRRLSVGSVFAGMSGVVTLVLLKTITRLQLGGAELQETVAQTLGNLVGQNFIEHSKMIAIIKSVPDHLSFQFGFTYLNSILVLIPRSLFPDKPFVNLDTTVGQVVYGCPVFGACAVPPGLLGESYLNFGVAGLFVLPILMGILVGKLDLRFKVTRPRSMFQIFYLVSGLYLGMAILGSGISSSITQLVTQSISVAIVCIACRRYSRPIAVTPRSEHVIESGAHRSPLTRPSA
jgi:oligosaccharide repeat unit polymerase